MEVIIKNFGGVDGIIMDPNAPKPQANEVLLATFTGQFNQMGLIVLVISFMGMIADEKKREFWGLYLQGQYLVCNILFQSFWKLDY